MQGTGLAKMLSHASPDCQDLIQRLLAYNPDDRLSARQALKHPYFRELRCSRCFTLPRGACLAFGIDEGGEHLCLLLPLALLLAVPAACPSRVMQHPLTDAACCRGAERRAQLHSRGPMPLKGLAHAADHGHGLGHSLSEHPAAFPSGMPAGAADGGGGGYGAGARLPSHSLSGSDHASSVWLASSHSGHHAHAAASAAANTAAAGMADAAAAAATAAGGAAWGSGMPLPTIMGSSMKVHGQAAQQQGGNHHAHLHPQQQQTQPGHGQPQQHMPHAPHPPNAPHPAAHEPHYGGSHSFHEQAAHVTAEPPGGLMWEASAPALLTVQGVCAGYACARLAGVVCMERGGGRSWLACCMLWLLAARMLSGTDACDGLSFAGSLASVYEEGEGGLPPLGKHAHALRQQQQRQQHSSAKRAPISASHNKTRSSTGGHVASSSLAAVAAVDGVAHGSPAELPVAAAGRGMAPAAGIARQASMRAPKLPPGAAWRPPVAATAGTLAAAATSRQRGGAAAFPSGAISSGGAYTKVASSHSMAPAAPLPAAAASGTAAGSFERAPRARGSHSSYVSPYSQRVVQGDKGRAAGGPGGALPPPGGIAAA